jgi:two-component system, response regulator PdtaR
MKRLNILVVEDEAIIALLLGDVLMSMGHDICAIEDTEADAIAAAFRWKPDLMIVDENLGQGSGLAVMAEVLRGGPVPYVMVSGDALRIRRLMPDAVIMEKPYRESDLARSIRSAMGCDREAADGGSHHHSAGGIQTWPPAETGCANP